MTGTPSHPGEPAQPADPLREEIANLQHVVRSHHDVGRALGLMTVRFACSTPEAWRTLQQVARDAGSEVSTVARVLVAAHDGSAGADDLRMIASFVDRLPEGGWPVGPWQDPSS